MARILDLMKLTELPLNILVQNLKAVTSLDAPFFDGLKGRDVVDEAIRRLEAGEVSGDCPAAAAETPSSPVFCPGADCLQGAIR